MTTTISQVYLLVDVSSNISIIIAGVPPSIYIGRNDDKSFSLKNISRNVFLGRNKRQESPHGKYNLNLVKDFDAATNT